MVYQATRCRSCGKLIRGWHVVTAEDLNVGPPGVRCPHCGVVSPTRQRPWRDLGRWGRTYFVVMCALMGFPTGGAIAVVLLIVVGMLPGGSAWLGAGFDLALLVAVGIALGELWVARDARRWIGEVERRCPPAADAPLD